MSEAHLSLPGEQPGGHHVYHLFVVRCDGRDAVALKMKESGIETGIHYPVAVHEQAAFRGAGRAAGSLRHAKQACREILSLPICPFTTDDEVDDVAVCLGEAVAHPERTPSLAPVS